MKPSISAGSIRAYSTRIPRPRLPERPPVRTNDPLANNSHAKVQELPGNLTFIHRPPPSAPTPHSFTTAPASPLLRASADVQSHSAELPPTTRPDTPPEQAHVSQEIIQQIRTLRREQPAKFTRSVLANLYGVTPGFVGMIAPSKQVYRREAHAAFEAVHQELRSKWGERKALAVEIRRRRKQFW
jgi:hypothetical protein